jgi:ribosomal protein S18 acetylase RimI-like enzyme
MACPSAGPDVDSRMDIRPCRESDLDALEWGGEFARDRQIIHSTFALTLEDAMVMLVADEAGALAGQAWIDLRRTPGVGLIWAVRVKRRHRGQHIGTKLVHACEQMIAARGGSVCELEVQPLNVGARRFYERLGYRHVRCDLARDDEGRVIGATFDVFQKLVRRGPQA